MEKETTYNPTSLEKKNVLASVVHTKIRMIQRLARLLSKDDMQIHETLHSLFKKKKKCQHMLTLLERD